MEERFLPGWRTASMSDVMAEARRCGYRPTQHGTLQRGLWRAYKVTLLGDGVMVRRAWTTAQIITLGVALTLIAIGVMGGR